MKFIFDDVAVSSHMSYPMDICYDTKGPTVCERYKRVMLNCLGRCLLWLFGRDAITQRTQVIHRDDAVAASVNGLPILLYKDDLAQLFP